MEFLCFHSTVIIFQRYVEKLDLCFSNCLFFTYVCIVLLMVFEGAMVSFKEITQDIINITVHNKMHRIFKLYAEYNLESERKIAIPYDSKSGKQIILSS